MSPEESFAAHRSLLDEMVLWRRRLKLPAGSAADRCLAFLVEVHFRRHAWAWRQALGPLLEEAEGNSLGEVLLAQRASQHFLEELSQRPGLYPPEVKEFLARRHTQRVAHYEESLARGQPIEVHAVPDEFLPDWYALAQPDHPLYQKAYTAQT